MIPPSSSSPFVGLRAFDVTDQKWFKGRTQETATLLAKAQTHRFTAVVGASGSGKSSLVRAGILPAFHQLGWQSIIVKPGSAPIAKLALAFSEHESATQHDTLTNARTHRFDMLLRQSAYGLNELTQRVSQGIPGLILVIDQFEELFRYGEEARGVQKVAMEEEGQAFVELLLTAANRQDSSLRIIITMRSDFFGNCAAYPGLAEAVSASQYLVPLPERDQLEVAIREPIEAAQGAIEPMLVQRLLLDVAKEKDLLPTLQHTLRRLWEATPGTPKQLRDQDYLAIGGIKGSINLKAEQVLDELQKNHPIDVLTLELLMKSITSLDEQDRATRRPQPLSDLQRRMIEAHGDAALATDSLKRVLAALSHEAVSFISQGTTDDPEIDISHEALIRSWLRLCGQNHDYKSGWLFEERENGRQWREYLRRHEQKRRLYASETYHFSQWLARHKLGRHWSQRYGDAWEVIQQLYQRSKWILSLFSLAASLVLTICLIGVFRIYDENQQQEQQIKHQQTQTLLQARAGALAAAALSRSYTDQGNARIGALIALAVTPNSRDEGDSRYVSEIGAALAHAYAHPYERWQYKHQNVVTNVAFSPDGNRIVFSSYDNTLRLWNAHTGQPIGGPLQGHQEWVLSVAFSPDGNRIVSASADKTLRLWDANTGQPIGEPLQGHQHWVFSVAFSPDGNRIVSASADKTLRLWDAHTGQPIGEPLQGHQEWVLSVAFSPDGNRIVSASADKTLHLWDAHTGQSIGKPLQGHQHWVFSVAFSPDGKRIVSASDDHTLRLWDANTNQPIGEPLQGHQNSVYSVAFSPDGSRIVSASADKTLRLWDANTNQPIGEPLQGHQKGVLCVVFSFDGNRIISASADKTLRLWDAHTGQLIGKPLHGHQKGVNSATFSPNGSRIVSASDDHTLRLWDADTGQSIGKPLHEHQKGVNSAAFSPNGNRIVSASDDQTLRLWDTYTGQSIGEPLHGHQDWVLSVAFSPDGNRIVSASADKTLRLWNAHTGQPIGEPLHGHQHWVFSVAFSPDGKRIVSASDDHTLRLWNAHTGQPIGEPLQGHQNSVYSVAFSPDGNRIVSASADKTLRLWNAHTNQPIGEPLKGHQEGVLSVAFSPDGNRIISASDDQTLRLWDAHTGQPIGESLHVDQERVFSVAFSPDGNRIVSAGTDNTLHLWDIRRYRKSSLAKLAHWAETLCPLSESERRQLGLYDPTTAQIPKPRTEAQRLACGE